MPTKQERLDRRVQSVSLLILATIATGVALFLLKPVLVPFVLALFFTYCLTPIIDAQVTRLRMPRWVALASTVIFGVAILSLIGFLVATAVGGMLHDLDVKRKEMNQRAEAPLVVVTESKSATQPTTQPKSSSLWEWLSLKRLLRQRNVATPDGTSGTGDTSVPALDLPEDALIRFVSGFLSQTMETISSGALVLLFMIFLLIGHNPRTATHTGLLGDIENRAKRYLGLMLFLSAAMGLFVALVLAVLGVKYAIVFGLLAFVLNFIPSIGGIIATLLPLPFILLDTDMAMTAKVMAIAVPGAMQFIMGNILQPKIQGESLELHPVVVLLALIFFGMIWGIVGAFLATPITAVIKIVLERMPATQAVARMLAGDLRAITDDWAEPPDTHGKHEERELEHASER